MTTETVYFRPPCETVEGIPVFSVRSTYTENYERIAADHLCSARQGKGNPFIPEALWNETEDATAALIRKYVAPGSAILDVGVGLGRLLERFSDLNRHGVDISLGYLREAKKKGIEVCYALVEELPYKSSVFDAVISTDVSEHVLDLNKASRNIIDSLKPGGYLIIRVPYRENLAEYVSPSCPYEFVHMRAFDEFSLWLHFSKLFKLEAVEFSLAGFFPWPQHLKYPTPSRILNKVMARALRFPWLACGPLAPVIRRCFLEVTINYVFRKPMH